jgi:hypothetical protein
MIKKPDSDWHPPYHLDLNGTPEFIRIGRDYPYDKRPTYARCETGRFAPISRIYSPIPMFFVQDWVDATPSTTASSDVERHEEIRRQTFEINSATTSTDLSVRKLYSLSLFFPQKSGSTRGR